MGLKKAENQVKILLAETILSMCRNTLNYHAEICVEGLLGITLDNEEIFLVNINQTIKNQIDTPGKAASSKENLKRSRKEDVGSDTEPESSSNESESSSTKKRRKRVRRKKHKGEKGSGSENGELADVSANADQTLQSDETDRKFSQVNLEQTDGSEQYYENSNQTAGDDSYTEEGAPSSVNVTVKQEPPGGPESDDDLVFVKQEVDEFSMSQPSAHQFSNLSQVFQSSADMSLSQPSDMMSGAFFASPANNMSANAMQQPVPGPSGANTGTLPRKNSTGRKVSSGSGSKGQGGKSASVKKGSSSAFDLTGITIVEDVDFREEISVKREIGESVDCGTVSIVKIEETGGPYTGYGLSPGLQALGRMIASGPPAAYSQASGRAAQSASLSHAAQSKHKGNQGVSLNVGQSVCQSVSQSPASAKGKSSAKKRIRKRVRPSMQGQNPEDSSSPCRCNLCGKEMSASALEAHMRIHTGERPFKCSLCGRDFVLKHKLKSHWIHAHKLPWKDEYA